MCLLCELDPGRWFQHRAGVDLIFVLLLLEIAVNRPPDDLSYREAGLLGLLSEFLELFFGQVIGNFNHIQIIAISR